MVVEAAAAVSPLSASAESVGDKVSRTENGVQYNKEVEK
jgi:hypothetical protein